MINFFVDTLHQLIYHQLCNIQRILCGKCDFTPNLLLPLCSLDLEISVICRLLLQNKFDQGTLSIIFLSETGPLWVVRSSYDPCVHTGRLECLHSLMSLLIATGNVILLLPGNFRSFLGFSKQTVIAFFHGVLTCNLTKYPGTLPLFFFICLLVGHSDLSLYNSAFLLFLSLQMILSYYQCVLLSSSILSLVSAHVAILYVSILFTTVLYKSNSFKCEFFFPDYKLSMDLIAAYERVICRLSLLHNHLLDWQVW